MLERYKYTDKEIKSILNSIVVLIDTREQSNNHIIKWLEDKKINYKNIKLDYGDYSFYIPENKELNIERDIYFTNDICIERKNSTDEIIGNFSQDRNRIEDEFLRHKGKMILLIEDINFYANICEGNYKSQYSKNSAIGTFHSFIDRYNLYYMFVNKDYSARFICNIFKYFIYNKLK